MHGRIPVATARWLPWSSIPPSISTSEAGSAKMVWMSCQMDVARVSTDETESHATQSGEPHQAQKGARPEAPVVGSTAC